MRFIKHLFLSFNVILFTAGCSHAPVQDLHQPEGRGHAVSNLKGVVLYEQALNQGGTLALTPFKAGAKAEANDELDHISMMILKGIKDTLESKGSNFQVVDASQGSPKMAIGGFINEYSKAQEFLQLEKAFLSIEGEVWLTSTGEKVVSFSIKKTFVTKQDKPKDVAYAFGVEIATFILKHASNCLEHCSS